MNTSNFLYGAILLSIVNFIVRFIGFIYKIILSRQIGPEAIGLFQIAAPVLSFFITFTTAGIPIAVSRLVAAQKALGNDLNSKKILRTALTLVFFISIFFISILFICGDFISSSILKNEDVYVLIIMLAPAIMIISISSVFRGYFYGLKKVSPPGISQIIEQLTRIAFVLTIVYYFKPTNPKLGASIAVLGIIVGEIFGFLWLIFHYKFLSKSQEHMFAKKRTLLFYLPKILYIATPITLSRLIGIGMQLINAVLIPRKLMESGYNSSEAISIFGKVMGMTMPILFLPFIVTSALVINIIPNLAEDYEKKRFNHIRNNISLCIRIVLIISIPLTVIFVSFSKPIALFLYEDHDVGRYLSILGFSTIFLSLQSTLSGMLNGLGKQINATINNMIGMSFLLLTTFFLVGNPSYGINGFFLGFIVACFINSTLNFITLNRVISIYINIKDYVLKPIFATLISIAALFLIYNYLFDIYNENSIILILSLSIGGLIYFCTLFITKALPYSMLKRIFSLKMHR